MLTLANRVYQHAGKSRYTLLTPEDVKKALIAFDDIPYEHLTFKYGDRVYITEIDNGLHIFIPENCTRRKLRQHLFSVLAHIYICGVNRTTPSVGWDSELKCIRVKRVPETRMLTAYLECHPDHAKQIMDRVEVYHTAENFGFCATYELSNALLNTGLCSITAFHYSGYWHDPDPRPRPKPTALTPQKPKPTPKRDYTPFWLTLGLVLALGFVIYSAIR